MKISSFFFFQKTETLMVRTYWKKRLFAEFVWLSYAKEAKHLRWNAAAKASSRWLTKTVPLNGLPSKATRHAMCASKMFRTYPSPFYESKVSELDMVEQVEVFRMKLVDTGKLLFLTNSPIGFRCEYQIRICFCH